MKSWFGGWWRRDSKARTDAMPSPPPKASTPSRSADATRALPSPAKPRETARERLRRLQRQAAERFARAHRPVDRPDSNYPQAYRLAQMGGPAIFDPALRNYSAGYREGDPTFASDEDRRRWWAARTALLEHAMRVVAESRWKEHLMLRGSALLKLFLGDEARSPGDIDWVVLTPGWTSTCDETEAILSDIARRFTEEGRVGEATVDPEQVARDPIWTYERADGMRLTFIGSIDGLPPLKVQCDFVFGETPWEPPMPLSIPTSDHREIALSAASPELSLAWKLLWLFTDAYPQGKDLYDAVMLAERYPLSQPLLDRMVAAVCEENGEYWRKGLFDGSFDDAFEENFVDIEWLTFAAEYPWVDPDLEGWVDRLKDAMPVLWDPEVWRR